MDKRLGLAAGLVGVLVVAGLLSWFLAAHKPSQPATTSATVTAATSVSKQPASPTTKSSDPVKPATPATPAFDKQQFSLSQTGSLWIIVNKHRPLDPKDYAPQLVTPNVGLRLATGNPEMQVSSQAAPALEQLFTAAKQAGYDLIIASGYRSYSTQISVYNAEVKNYGQATADRESARPGYSEHQTGLAIDVGAASRKCEVQQCFGDMPEGQWLAANAYTYGFVIRYPNGSEPVTGYTYEPWHIRYVSTALATQIHANGNQPLETFFGLDAAPDYQ